MGFLAPKRHRMKHLDFDLLLVRDQGVRGSNPLSPTKNQWLAILQLGGQQAGPHKRPHGQLLTTRNRALFSFGSTQRQLGKIGITH